MARFRACRWKRLSRAMRDVVGWWGQSSSGAVVPHLVAQAGAASCGPKVQNQAVRAGFCGCRWGRTVGGWWVWGFMGSQPMYGEFGVSCHVGRGWCCLPWDLHPFLSLHLLPTHSIHSTSSAMQILKTYNRAGHGPIGLALQINMQCMKL